jgi:hypothetical protein
VDHPASDSTISGGPSDPNQVIVRIPEHDDPRWRTTHALDTLIVVRADTLRRDPRPDPNDPDDNNEVVRQTTFERWHTFFVRAVDDRGAVDTTPDYRTFNARTLAPTVSLRGVSEPAETFYGYPVLPNSLLMKWDGRDPMGDGSTTDPVAARWVLIPLHVDVRGVHGFPNSIYYLPRGVEWSEWFEWNRSDGRGREARLLNIPLENRYRGDLYVFAVQAMDESGAVTPVFDASTTEKNNAAIFFVSEYLAPVLTISERLLGVFNFIGDDGRPVQLDVAAGQRIEFRWLADASGYGGEVADFRYGWNLRNPESDAEWEADWSPTLRVSTPRSFADGSHNFYLQCRDRAGVKTSVRMELTVHEVTRRRDLLMVDDSDQPRPEHEPLEDAQWRTVLDSLVARRPSIVFDPSRDIYDVFDNRSYVLPLEKLFDAKTVIWAVVEGRSGSALNAMGRLFDPFLRVNTGAVPPFNYLNVYLENGGEIWVSGDQAGQVLWPSYRDVGLLGLPFNITNWDDPREQNPPHPDSAGVSSLLFRLGVEMLDLGGGGRAPQPRRDQLVHNCTGFRRYPGVMNAPEFLTTGEYWPLPRDPTLNPRRSRPNVEIYNDPIMLAMPRTGPPLQPPPDLWLPLYSYRSSVPADPAAGIQYPLTADGSPAVILRKARATDQHYSRALCGFEAWLLDIDSHLALADLILLQYMRLGLPENDATNGSQ